jgi:hypothetical protein
MDIKQALAIPFYSNMTCQTFGLDSAEQCLDPVLFENYPESINYQFNELGYRDCSYTQYQGNEIVAIGDSFTLGLGVNVEQTWPKVLEKLLNYPVRNFSLNGASNDWMARKIVSILDFFQPRAVIVHYSFSHRRERPFDDWHDNERTESEPIYTQEQNIENWQKNYEIFSQLSVPVIHSFIPDWDQTEPDYKSFGSNMLAPVKKQDLARDGFHYGVKTNRALAVALAGITNLLAV